MPTMRMLYVGKNKINRSPLSVRQVAHIGTMDDEEFRRRLSEVAEWKIPETPRETTLGAKKKRGRKSKEEQYQDEHEEVFMELFEGVNPTYTPLLTKIKYAPTTCECGRVCSSGCEKEAKLCQTKDKTIWKWKCKTCGMTQDPYTGEYILNAQKASIVWNSFLRETKGCYASKGNLVKKIVSEDTITIRKYPDTMRDD
jgi:hypothetical protein